MTREEKIKAQALRAAGKGYSAIAREMGLSVSTVTSFCKKHMNDTFDVCPQCGVRLKHVPKHKKKKFCSDKCRMLWWNAHLDQVNRQTYYPAVCNHCGKEFLAYGNDHRKFCSRECTIEHSKKRRPEVL